MKHRIQFLRRRREFITLIAGAATAWPLAGKAQQPKPASRLGFLTQAPVMSPIEDAFRQGLRDFGYVDGQNLIIEYRSGAGRVDRLAELAADLVAAKVDVIFAAGSEATSAARQTTSSVPIVMTSTNPVGLGFVASLARPGSNVTGLSLLGPETSGKRLELIKEMIPGIAKVAVLWNPNDPGARFSLQETQAAAETLKLDLQILETRDVDAFDGAFAAARNEGAAAGILLPAPLMSRNAGRIADLAVQRRLPTLFFSEDSVKAGGLISYGANLIAMNRRAAYFVDRILKGAHPADLPVEQPTVFELAINLKTAKALGLEVPPSLLARADEVIE
jgi:putative tryptophan/tyrosine transport system substrate-binding protein